MKNIGWGALRSYIYMKNKLIHKLEVVRSPPWLRMLQIVIGSIAVTLSVAVLILLAIVPGAAILTIILILSIVFLIFGIERIAIGVSPLSPTRKIRFTNVVIGVVVIALSVFLMEFPIVTSAFLITIAGLALLLSGITRIIHGVSKGISGYSRGFLIGVGALSVIISLLVIANPIRFGAGLLAIMLTAILLIGGIEMVVLGAKGDKKNSITPPPPS
jgi:uncharacterized membrane protein HdeD (DUF308 family)